VSTVVNPATEEPLAELESAGVEETDEAIHSEFLVSQPDCFRENRLNQESG